MDSTNIILEFSNLTQERYNYVLEAYEELKDVCDVKINPAPQTIWTPITGEASLPTDDEALCLFAEWEAGIMKDRWIVKWKVAKTDISHYHFTHYTILQPPVK